MDKKTAAKYSKLMKLISETNKTEKNAKEIVGSAMYKIDQDCCIFLTANDKNLTKIYNNNKGKADELAKRILEITKTKYDFADPRLLSSCFNKAYNKTYGQWRRSLGYFFY